MGYRWLADSPCFVLRTPSVITAQQADRILVAQHEKRRLLQVVFVLGYQDSNLE